MASIRVAVFPCGSEVGLEINRSLRFSQHFELIGLSSVSDHGRTVYNRYFDNLPSFKETDFLPRLQQIISTQKINFLIPAMDEVGAFLKENETNLKCDVVCADKDIMKVLISKTATYKRLKGKVPVPELYHEYSIINDHLPVFTKPDIGYGSRNTELITTEVQLRKRWNERKGILFCEYLPGKEYTIDCFSDKNHQVLFAGPRIRKRVRMGISVNTLPVNLEGIECIAEKISLELKLKGIWFFQMKENIKGELVLMEVASRVSGSMAMNRLRGINLILLELYQRLDYPVSVQQNGLKEMELERSFDCKLVTSLDFDIVFVDFEDCLVIGEKVNTQLVHFLYQQINENRKVMLFANDGKLKCSIEKFRLGRLFDEIIYVSNKKNKFKYMQDKSAIFISNSYEDRMYAMKLQNIPAFDLDVVNSLIDQRKL